MTFRTEWKSDLTKTSKFVEKAINVHKDLYDYSLSEYINCKAKIKIICNTHGIFLQSPSDHLQGKGCQVCGGNSHVSNESLLIKFNEIHGDTYDYSLVSNTNANMPLIIICRKHGKFLQQYHKHLSGQGCPDCGKTSSVINRRLSNDEFIRKAKEVHGDTYNYVKTKYVTSSSIVEIICNVHGSFKQSAKDHLHCSAGCPACTKTGYQSKKPGFIYVLKGGNITKVGITNSPVKIRADSISKESNIKFEIILAIKFEDGKIPDQVETEVLRELRKTHEGVTEVFNGHTECFKNVATEILFKNIVAMTYKKFQENKYGSSSIHI